jgi:hypothetical protein
VVAPAERRQADVVRWTLRVCGLRSLRASSSRYRSMSTCLTLRERLLDLLEEQSRAAQIDRDGDRLEPPQLHPHQHPLQTLLGLSCR